MLYYEYTLSCTMSVDKKTLKLTKKKEKKKDFQNKLLVLVNKQLTQVGARLGLANLGSYDCSVLGLDEDKNLKFGFKVIACKKPNQVIPEDFSKQLADIIASVLPIKKVMIGSKEAIPNDLNNMQFQEVAKAGRSFLNSLGLPDSTMGEFQLAEYALEPKEGITEDKALELAEDLGMNAAFKAELKRIYSNANAKSFVTHPVHYVLEMDREADTKAVLELLTGALYENQRLLSLRIDEFGSFDSDISFVDNLNSFFAMAEGATVVIRTNNDESNNFNSLVELLKTKIYRMCKNTLFIIVEDKQCAGFANELVEALKGQISIIKMGSAEAMDMPINETLAKMAAKCGLDELFRAKPPVLLKSKKSYSAEEINSIFNTWAQEIARSEFYKAYEKECFAVEEKPSVDSLKELEKLIGLKEAKVTAKELLAAAKVNAVRQQKGLPCENRALHMLFTGNPGSAKTTFARLVAKILAEHGIIKSNKLVECGRADLVGQYVGWTAKCVKDKFAEAAGGVLFIDEAYSLIGEGKDFGAEAISTIVQEMENHRNDVVVIFAGYPEKMEEFLKQNEGLRSRIPYHMHFPDYTAEELLAILRLMVKERGYEMTDGFEEKCKAELAEVLKTKDFGNGRYIRNLLEKAVAKQSARLLEQGGLERMSKAALQRLEAADYPVLLCPKVALIPHMGIAL